MIGTTELIEFGGFADSRRGQFRLRLLKDEHGYEIFDRDSVKIETLEVNLRMKVAIGAKENVI